MLVPIPQSRPENPKGNGPADGTGKFAVLRRSHSLGHAHRPPVVGLIDGRMNAIETTGFRPHLPVALTLANGLRNV